MAIIRGTCRSPPARGRAAGEQRAAWQVPTVQLPLARMPWPPCLNFSPRGATRRWAIWDKVSETMTRREGGFWAEPPRSEPGGAQPLRGLTAVGARAGILAESLSSGPAWGVGWFWDGQQALSLHANSDGRAAAAGGFVKPRNREPPWAGRGGPLPDGRCLHGAREGAAVASRGHVPSSDWPGGRSSGPAAPRNHQRRLTLIQGAGLASAVF